MTRDGLLQNAIIPAGIFATIGTVLCILCIWQRLSVLDAAIKELSDNVQAQSRVLKQLATTMQDAMAEQKSEEDALARCDKNRGNQRYSEDPYSWDSIYSARGDRRRLFGQGISHYDYRDSLSAYDRRSSYDYGLYDSDDYGYQYGAYDYDRPSYDFSSTRYGSYFGGFGMSKEEAQKGLRRQFRNRTRALERILWKGASDVQLDLDRVTEASSSRWAIPFVLHQTWKTSEVPSKFSEHLASWRRLHRDWRFEFWDDARSRDFVAEHFPKYIRDYDRMSGIKKADVIRIVALYVQGGVYADIDVEAVQSFGPLLSAALAARAGVILGEENFVHSVLLEQRSTWLVSNAVMASAAGHPFWLEALREIFSHTWCGDDPVQCTGPRLIDRLSWDYVRRSQSCGIYGCLVRLPFDYFSPDIAFWNARNMAKECSLQGAETYWYTRKKQRRKLVLRACRGLEHSLSYPAALRTKHTFAVHHWQCSWCREDDSLRGTMQLDEVIWRVGNETQHQSKPN